MYTVHTDCLRTFSIAMQSEPLREGIKPEFLPHVFDRFQQADSSSIHQYGGLGLGLAIVQHLVELHGGMVRAKSRGEGKGATFIVSLPARLLHADMSV